METDNFEAYSPGLVIKSCPGLTAFPVALTLRTFDLMVERLIASGVQPPYTLWDPCVGGGYVPTVLGLLRPQMLRRIYCSDIDQDVLAIAEKNLKLLTELGLRERIAELTALKDAYNKESHSKGLKYAEQFLQQRLGLADTVDIQCSVYDLMAGSEPPIPASENLLVFVDPPYGRLAHWQGAGATAADPLAVICRELGRMLPKRSIVAIATGNKGKFDSGNLRRVEKIKAGVRRVTIFIGD